VTKFYTGEYFTDRVENKAVPVSRNAACFILFYFCAEVRLRLLYYLYITFYSFFFRSTTLLQSVGDTYNYGSADILMDN